MYLLLGLSMSMALRGYGQPGGRAEDVSNELRTRSAFDRIKGNPLELRQFLEGMPKGGDLHLHLSGGTVYAETLIRDAAEDGLCATRDTRALYKPAEAGSEGLPGCGARGVPVKNVFRDQKLYDALVNAYSMRSFVPYAGFSGHDQFFSTFDRFSAIEPAHVGEWVDEITTRASAENEQYIEAMYTPSFAGAAGLGYKLGWKGDSAADMRAMRDALLAGGLRDEVATDRKEFDGIEAARAARQHCGEPQATVGCAVKVRYLYQVLRGFPPEQVFAQTLLGFEVASVDPRVVGLNFVMPEDGYLSMRDYRLQMRMIDLLHGFYPAVRISLHAGELAPGMVPPEGLRFHIRDAVELGHAERIGHGIDVASEDDSQALLRELAAKHVLIEINLTSNDVILGIKGKEHPLSLYRVARVPVALATDDEGVSRIDLTHEFEKGVEEQGLGYLELKAMARASLEHAFLPGESLWATPDDFRHRRAVCAGEIGSLKSPSPGCASFLKSSERATEQYELERRFAVFEAGSR